MRHVYYVLAIAALAACGDDPVQDLLASAVPVTTVEDTPKTFEILTNLPINVQVTAAPIHGEVAGAGTQWMYTPAENYSGDDAVTLLATANGDVVELAIPIAITAVNDAPLAVADSFATNSDIAVSFEAALLLANDSDVEGSPLTLTTVSNAASGGVVLSGDQITFTPTLGFAGMATFEYTVTDGEASSNGVVTVAVGVDQAPIAVDDAASTTEDVPVTLTTAQLLGNDSDPDGHLISISSVDNCFKCTVIKAGSSITVTPAANATGTATFEYTITDGALTDTGLVSIALTSVEDAPIAGADTATTTEDTAVQLDVATLLANDTDGDADTLTITAVSGAALDTGIITFTPPANFTGDTTFQYTVTDPSGLTGTGTVTVTVTAVPDAPIANTDAITAPEDGSGSVDVLGNDTDADGDAISLQSFTQPGHGVVTFVGTVATYTPVADFNGADSFTYTIADGTGGIAVGTVDVSVTAINDAPIAFDDTVAVVEETPTVIAALANDFDIDADTLVFVAVTQGAHGSVQLAGGSVTYTPAANYVGPDGFDYTVSDGNGGTDSGHVTIAVSNVNDAPVATADTLGTDENTPVSANVLANDTDADLDGLTVQSFTQGAHGTVTFAGPVATYTPALNFSDTDTFSYTISDGNGGTSTAAVTVFVGLDNDPPVAVDDTATVAEETATTISVLGNDSDIDGNPIAVTAVTAPEHGSISLVAGVITYTPTDNYFGPDGFDYVINDGFGGTDIGHVTINVTNVNDAPVAVNDTITTAEDTFVTLNVTLNDTDLDGDTLEVESFTQPAHGTVVFIAAEARYTPALDYNGPDSFTYKVNDGDGGTATATVSVTVTAVNDAPVAGDDARTAVEETATTIAVLGNDNDVDGDTVSVTAVGTAGHGTVTLAAGVITYTPALNFFGTDAFDYTISDGNGGTDLGRVTLTVTNVNDPPVAVNDTLSTNEDTAKNLNVVANDSDVDNDALTIQSFTQPANGTVTFAGNVATFTPALNFNGTTSFTYTIKDPSNTTATATVNINVIAVNDKPDAVNDAITTNEDTQSAALDLLGNDTDVDVGQTLTVTSNTTAPNGTVTRTGSSVRYTPKANFNGTDAFTYTISDGNGGTDTATVTITVVAVNDTPDAVNDAITTAEDTESASINLLGNDTDVDTGQTLTITGNTNPANGTLTFTGGSVTYKPNLDFNGSDAFTYTISDGNGGTDTATVNVTVTAVNDAPVAVADAITTAEDTQSASLDLVTNDTDVDTGQTLSITATSTPANGTVARTGNSVRYTPNSNFNGTDSFTYTISDGNGGTDTAAVTVTVTPVNDPPVAVADAITTDEDTQSTALDLLANDNDGDPELTQTLSITTNTNPANGTLAFTGGSVRYTPNADFNGTDSFTYTVSDGALTATATVSITVTATNDAPVATADTITTAEDTQSVTVNLLANDNDGDPELTQTLTITANTTPSNGTLAFTGGSVRYTPAANFNGSDSFTYTVSDGSLTDTATVTITVTAVNDLPVATNDAITTTEDTASASVNLLTNDNDGDPELTQTLSITGNTSPANGTLSFTGGSVTYTPNANFAGTDSFSYTLSDGALTDTATVSITVTAANDAPVATADTIATNEDTQSTSVNLLANDNDGDPEATQTLTITGNTNPAHGTLSFSGGSVQYTPAANFNGTDSFTYTVSDGALTDTATVNITVAAQPDNPNAVDDTFNNVSAGTTDLDVLANDGDVDGETVTLAAITAQPANGSGTVTIAGGKARYVVAANFSGTATFTYQITDSTSRTDTATVTVNVSASNQAPTADDVSESSDGSAIQIFLTGSDPEQGAITFETPANVAGGTISNFDENTGELTFSPSGAGTASFTYRVKDDGGLFSDIATVTIFVAGCGDNSVDPQNDEECDDGNQVDGDGCDSNCAFTCGSNGDNIIPDAVEVDPVTSHCFARYDDNVKFNDARQLCAAAGGHLATVTDSDEHQAVQKLAGTETWIGGTDLPNQLFRWITGEPFDLQNAHFRSNQPDGGDLENCLATTNDGWFDADCFKTISYVCEFNDTLPSAECGNDILEIGEECDDGGQEGGDGCEANCKLTCGSNTGAVKAAVSGTHCFVVVDEGINFAAATERCDLPFGGTLATVLSTEDDDAVATLIDAVGGAAWLGANKDLQTNDFVQWLSGDPFELDAFIAGEPDDKGTLPGAAGCLAITKDGWIDETCNTPHAMICQVELVPAIITFKGGVFANMAKYGTVGEPSR